MTSTFPIRTAYWKRAIVFLNGNHFPARFADHPRPLCIIAETGFGTGLNFLTLWQTFEAFHSKNPEATLQRLHFISYEKFPLSARNLIAAHAQWPEMADYSAELCEQWPMPFAGCHRVLIH